MNQLSPTIHHTATVHCSSNLDLRHLNTWTHSLYTRHYEVSWLIHTKSWKSFKNGQISRIMHIDQKYAPFWNFRKKIVWFNMDIQNSMHRDCNICIILQIHLFVLEWYHYKWSACFNSSVPGRCGHYIRSMSSTLKQNITWGTYCEIGLLWVPQKLTNENSTLVQVMASCCQATNVAKWCH